MIKLIKITFLSLILFLFLAATGFVILYNFTSVINSSVQSIINDNLPDDTRIRIGNISGNLLNTIDVADIDVSLPNGKMVCKRISAEYDLFDVLRQKYNIGRLRISEPLFRYKNIDTLQTAVQDTVSLPQKIMSIFSDSLFLKMPDVALDNLEIKKGQFILNSANVFEKIDSINIEMKARLNQESINLHLLKSTARWPQRQLHLREFSFNISGNRDKITFNQVKLKSDPLNLYLHGETILNEQMPMLYLFSDTSMVELSTINHFLPEKDSLNGNIKFAFDFIGNREVFNGNVFLQGNKDSLRIDKLIAKFNLRENTFSFDDIKVYSNFGYLSGKTKLARFKQNEVDLNFRKIDIGMLNLSSQSTKITGKIVLQFNSWNIKQLSGNGYLFLKELNYANANIDTIQLRLTAKNGNWEIEKKSRFVVDPASKFFIDGTMDKEGKLFLHLETDENNLDTLDSKLGLGFLGGSGSLDLVLAGNYWNPDLFGYFLLDSLTIKDQPAYGIEGRIELIGLLREKIGYFVLDLSSANIENVEITDGLVKTKVNGNLVTIDSLSFYNYDNYFNTKGRIASFQDTINVNLKPFIFRYKDYSISAPEAVQLYYSNDSLAIQDFFLETNFGGEIEARGGINFSNDVNLGIYFNKIHLDPFNQFHHSKYNVNGLFYSSFEAMGSLDLPIIDIDLGLSNLSVGSDYIGDVSSILSIDSNRVNLESFNVSDSNDVKISASGKFFLDKTGIEKKENELSLNINQFEFGNLSFAKELNFPLAGNLSANIDINGNLTNPGGTVDFNMSDVQFKEYKIPEIRLTGRVSPKKFIIDNLNLDINNSLLNVRGFKKMDWQIDSLKNILNSPGLALNLRMQEDSLNFLKYINPEIDIITGDISANLKITGQLANPTLESGNISINDGALYLTKIENPLENLKSKISIRNNKVFIDEFSGVFRREKKSGNFLSKIVDFFKYPVKKIFGHKKDKSYLTMNGDVDFKDITRPRLNLGIESRNSYINYFLENTKLVFSSEDLTITGQDTILVLGGIEVHEGEINIDIAESEKNLLLSTALREKAPYLKYLLGLKLPSNFYVRSESALNTFDMQIKGEVSVVQSPNSLLEVYGELFIENGKYFQFEEFKITEGKLKFVNPKELPEIEITAEKQKYDYLFKLKVYGSLQNPTKEIRIYDLVTNEDKTYLYPDTKDQIALLLFGVTFKELSSGSSKLLLEKGQDILSRAVLTRIESEARKFTGLDQIRLESGKKTTDRLNQSSSGKRLSLGKYLTPKLYLQYKAQLGSAGLPGLGNIPTPDLSWESGNQLFLEYRINKSWSLSTFYEKERNDKFKVDIKWRHNF